MRFFLLKMESFQQKQSEEFQSMNQVLRGKKGIIKKGLIVISALLMLLLMARCIYVNLQYPSPKVRTYSKGEVMYFGNYEISLTGWRWGDGEIIHEIYPGYILIEKDGEEYPTNQQRVGLAEVTIKKVEDDNTFLDFTSMWFESGAWGNQFDMELFMHINPQLDGLGLKMKKGETATVTFPITMLDIQFSSGSWKNIDDREFYVVLQFYPEKIRLLCNE